MLALLFLLATKGTSDRLTSFPILLLIALYERQAKQSGALTFYETLSSAAEKIYDALPRPLKRICKRVYVSTVIAVLSQFHSQLRGTGRI